MLKGKRLVTGSKIGVVAPANSVKEESVYKAKKKLEALGFKVELGKSCTSSWYGFAGTDEVRADDINRMFKDSSIDGIICLRGGYGSIRLLDRLDYDLIKSNPKVFMGYSDITSIHGILNKRCELITFHGPMATSNILNNFDEITAESFYDSVCRSNSGYDIKNPKGIDLKIVNEGCATGEVVGGNLAVMVSALGTEYDIDTKDKILFIEDIGETTYRIDRMLMQLLQAGKLDDAKGIILGDFADCKKDSEADFSLEEVFENILKRVDRPIISGLMSGHCKPMLTLPFGARVRMDTKEKSIRVMENTVV